MQIGKNVDRPDLNGYVLHEESALPSPAAADAASLRLANEIAKTTGIEFLDIQASNAPEDPTQTSANATNSVKA